MRSAAISALLVAHERIYAIALTSLKQLWEESKVLIYISSGEKKKNSLASLDERGLLGVL